MHHFWDISANRSQSPNVTFLTFKMTFRVTTTHHLYFRTALTSLQWSHMVQSNWATSVLLNNIDKDVKRGQIRPFWPWKRTFKAIQANPSFGSSLVPFLGSYMPKYRKSYWTVLEQMAHLSAKRAKFDHTDLEKWPLERFKQIYLSICDLYVTPKKLHAKKEEKVLKRFRDRPLPPPPSILMDRWTDRQTNRH